MCGWGLDSFLSKESDHAAHLNSSVHALAYCTIISLFELLTTASNPIDLDLGTSALQIVISYSCLGIIHSTWDR
jgi:hypothetical protein